MDCFVDHTYMNVFIGLKPDNPEDVLPLTDNYVAWNVRKVEGTRPDWGTKPVYETVEPSQVLI